MRDARPLGIAPPTIPFGADPVALGPVVYRPFGEDFLGTETGSVRREHVADGAREAVVAGKRADAAAHDLAGVGGAEPLAAAFMGELQKVAAFQCVKHRGTSSPVCCDPAHRIVNMPPRRRAMEAWHA